MSTDTSFLSPAPIPPIAPIPQPQRKAIPVWRWWVHLLIIAGFPVFIAAGSQVRRTEREPMLPSSVPALVMFCLLEIGVFAAFWVLAWAFSRATQDELWMRWRDGIRPPIMGFFYAIGLKLALIVGATIVLVCVAVVLMALGYKPEHLKDYLQANKPQVDQLMGPATSNGDPIYRLLLVTLLSFGVAGGREEIWRVGTMAGVIGVCPASWSTRTREIVAVVFAAIVFGIGHIYQGWMGVVLTTFLGLALGAITLRHRSVWPAVIAHGFFDAHSFYLAITTAKPPHAGSTAWLAIFGM